MAVGGMLCSSLSLLAFRVCTVYRFHHFLTEVFPSVSLLSFNVLYMKPFSQQDGILWPGSQGRSDLQTAAAVSGCSDRMHCFPLYFLDFLRCLQFLSFLYWSVPSLSLLNSNILHIEPFSWQDGIPWQKHQGRSRGSSSDSSGV